jgi:hypothetical protein
MFLYVSRQSVSSAVRHLDSQSGDLEGRIDAWLTDPSEIVLAPLLMSS